MGWQVGIWPIGEWEPAKRKSKNSPKGTLVWKNKMVTQEVYQDLLISKLLNTILEKWPSGTDFSGKYSLNKMGQKSHHENNRNIKEALMEKGINGKLYTQAASSPDMNLLDLGFSEQSRASTIQHRKTEELIQAVSMVYDNYLQNKSIIPGSPYNAVSTR